MLDRNTPTIFNAARNFRFNWSGRYRDVAEQNEFIILSPRLMNTNWVELIGKLRADSEYRAAFEKAYGGAIHAEQVLDALVSYERSLVTPNRASIATFGASATQSRPKRKKAISCSKHLAASLATRG